MIYVFTADPECPTVWALRQEDLAFRVLINEGEFGYGRNWLEVWDRGEPFVALEHDVIPWPGACKELLECPEPRCQHRFSGAPPGNLPMGLGAIKVVPVGPAPAEWASIPWNRLDGWIVPHLNEELGWEHVHEPPFAHARASLIPSP